MPQTPDSRSTPVEVSQEDLVSVLYNMYDDIAMHEVVFDKFNSIIDAQLVWWNDTYQKVRVRPVVFHQSMNDTYFEPHVALSHVVEAWRNGRSFQYFELAPSTRDRYRTPGARVAMWVNWIRVGDRIVEAGTNVSEIAALQDLLHSHKSLTAIASKRRALAVERERIARNLHDNVIQQLYATALSLSTVIGSAEVAMQPILKRTLESINKVVGDIRREILDVESRNASPLWRQLEESLIPILEPAGAELEVEVPATHIDDEYVPHIRAVAMEGASNAVRHGGAGIVWVKLKRVGDFLELNISDNGSGFGVDAPLQNGVKNMQDRASSLGGTMHIDARVGGGTSITWTVPYLEKEKSK